MAYIMNKMNLYITIYYMKAFGYMTSSFIILKNKILKPVHGTSYDSIYLFTVYMLVLVG